MPLAPPESDNGSDSEMDIEQFEQQMEQKRDTLVSFSGSSGSSCQAQLAGYHRHCRGSCACSCASASSGQLCLKRLDRTITKFDSFSLCWGDLQDTLCLLSSLCVSLLACPQADIQSNENSKPFEAGVAANLPRAGIATWRSLCWFVSYEWIEFLVPRFLRNSWKWVEPKMTVDKILGATSIPGDTIENVASQELGMKQVNRLSERQRPCCRKTQKGAESPLHCFKSVEHGRRTRGVYNPTMVP